MPSSPSAATPRRHSRRPRMGYHPFESPLVQNASSSEEQAAAEVDDEEESSFGLTDDNSADSTLVPETRDGSIAEDDSSNISVVQDDDDQDMSEDQGDHESSDGAETVVNNGDAPPAIDDQPPPPPPPPPPAPFLQPVNDGLMGNVPPLNLNSGLPDSPPDSPTGGFVAALIAIPFTGGQTTNANTNTAANDSSHQDDHEDEDSIVIQDDAAQDSAMTDDSQNAANIEDDDVPAFTLEDTIVEENTRRPAVEFESTPVPTIQDKMTDGAQDDDVDIDEAPEDMPPTGPLPPINVQFGPVNWTGRSPSFAPRPTEEELISPRTRRTSAPPTFSDHNDEGLELVEQLEPMQIDDVDDAANSNQNEEVNDAEPEGLPDYESPDENDDANPLEQSSSHIHNQQDRAQAIAQPEDEVLQEGAPSDVATEENPSSSSSSSSPSPSSSSSPSEEDDDDEPQDPPGPPTPKGPPPPPPPSAGACGGAVRVPTTNDTESETPGHLPLSFGAYTVYVSVSDVPDIEKTRGSKRKASDPLPYAAEARPGKLRKMTGTMLPPMVDQSPDSSASSGPKGKAGDIEGEKEVLSPIPPAPKLRKPSTKGPSSLSIVVSDSSGNSSSASEESANGDDLFSAYELSAYDSSSSESTGTKRKASAIEEDSDDEDGPLSPIPREWQLRRLSIELRKMGSLVVEKKRRFY